MFFTPTAGAIYNYYVAAGGAHGQTGTYTLSVTDVTDDFSAGTGTEGAVEVGGSVAGEIDYRSDQDWFAVTLEADKIYQFDLEGSETGADALQNPYLRGIYDADGVRFSGTTNNDRSVATRDSRVYFTAPEDATYYVAAGAWEFGWASGTGTYTLSVTDADDFAADTGTTGSVTVGGSVMGEIDHV